MSSSSVTGYSPRNAQVKYPPFERETKRSYMNSRTDYSGSFSGQPNITTGPMAYQLQEKSWTISRQCLLLSLVNSAGPVRGFSVAVTLFSIHWTDMIAVWIGSRKNDVTHAMENSRKFLPRLPDLI